MSDNEDYLWIPGDVPLAEDADGRPFSATSQEGRSAFLRDLDSRSSEPAPPPANDLLSRISRAEALVSACEASDGDAQYEMREAQAEAPRFAHDRTLSPEERTAYLRFDQAAARASETSASLAHWRAELSRLLGQYDRELGEARMAMDGDLAKRRLVDPREEGWG